MSITSYSHFTDQELLNFLSEKRYQSPIISELCKRLEAYPSSLKDTPILSDCPVCDAKLSVEINTDSFDNYELDIKPR